MMSVPQQHQPHHDPALAALRHSYPEWEIGYEAVLHVFTAEKRSADGRSSLRFLAGHDIAELAARLEVATTVAGP